MTAASRLGEPPLTMPLLTLAQVALILTVNQDTVLGMVRSGELPTVILGEPGHHAKRKTVRFRLSDVGAYVMRQIKQTNPAPSLKPHNPPHQAPRV